jgi:hypothetical protein
VLRPKAKTSAFRLLCVLVPDIYLRAPTPRLSHSASAKMFSVKFSSLLCLLSLSLCTVSLASPIVEQVAPRKLGKRCTGQIQSLADVAAAEECTTIVVSPLAIFSDSCGAHLNCTRLEDSPFRLDVRSFLLIIEVL